MPAVNARSCTLAAAAALLVGYATADQVTIEPAKDNTLYEDVGGALSNGAGSGVFAGRNGAGLIRRGLVSFDVAAAVPAGSTITSVSLAVNVTQASGGATPINLHRATADWGEGTSNATTGGGGGGTASTTGDATWIHRSFNTQTWTTPGGDFSGTVSATASISGIATYSFASSSQFVADVQQMLDSPSTNFGWVVRGEESVNNVSKRFDSRHVATAANRPRLVVDYSPPSGLDDWTAYD